jgi:hypothetical protein
MNESQSLKDGRSIDPLPDRRSGKDRRKFHVSEFFKGGGIERRSGIESRQKGNHSAQSISVSRAQSYIQNKITSQTSEKVE